MLIIVIAMVVFYFVIKDIYEREYFDFETKVIGELGLFAWDIDMHYEECITVNSRHALEKYDHVKFFGDNKEKFAEAERIIKRKNEVAKKLNEFLRDNKYKTDVLYPVLRRKIRAVLENESLYRIHVEYISTNGKILGERTISVSKTCLNDMRLVSEYRLLEKNVLNTLGFKNWDMVPYHDDYITVKSRRALENYDYIRYFREAKDRFQNVERTVAWKNEISQKLNAFLGNNEYKTNEQYSLVEKKIYEVLEKAKAYRIVVKYISPAGNYLDKKTIEVNQESINMLYQEPAIIMGKGEYNKLLKKQQKEASEKKHHEYYEMVSEVIDYANGHKDGLLIKGAKRQLDELVAQLFDRTVNSIKRIKSIDSEEWDVVEGYVTYIESEIEKVVQRNKLILAYYESENFRRIKGTCEALMHTQKEFNDYITEKVESISKLFGTRIVRNETINDDEYNYVRPYKKTVTPFAAEVSAAVFASAENNPLEYIVKYFYPNKHLYSEQIDKLYVLVEELETLKEAKQIIENYKAEYQEYIVDVPTFVMENDEAGFYSRLGFANIDEEIFSVEYKFSYTSGGGMVQRSFTVPMTIETIAELIELLKSKLAISAFVKEQRSLMTNKLREFIKKRDNYTCCNCGNSVFLEPNLLLEIDHKIPVSKGGCTEEDNLQTLCWKCNRSKGDKIL